eukprot:gene29311-23988_t
MVVGAAPGLALDNGVGLTPLLGWSTWNMYENQINESLVLRIADGLVASGLADAGFKYINLDAGVWEKGRSEDGKIQANAQRFPSGLAALSASLRSKGLKLGLYTDLSNDEVGAVCGTGPGSFGSYKEDAQVFADAGAEFLKVDYCAYDKKNTT